MTDEELDVARAKEAMRLCTIPGSTASWPALHAARLAREGWTPVDPDLIEARECAAWARLAWRADPYAHKDNYLSGKYDGTPAVQSALIAIKRAKERG
jgi:hypothetical protein